MTEKKREYFDILVVIPLEEELEPFMEIFPGLEDRSTSTMFRYVVKSGVDGISMLVVKQEGMGKTHAANATQKALDDFDVGLVVCLGIAGSLTGDLTLGDVCYSGLVSDVLDNCKASDVEGGMDVTLSPAHFKTENEITAAFSFIRTMPDLKPAYSIWQKAQYDKAIALIPGELPARDGAKATLSLPTTMDGTLVCGWVTKSEKYNTKLKGLDRKVLAVETESGGVFEKAHAAKRPAVAIRGISDLADENKGKLENVTGKAVRKIAASNATSFLALQLDNPHFQKVIRKQHERSLFDGQSQLPTLTQRPITEVIADMGSHILEQLRALAPEYKLIPKGYRFPIPRVRRRINKGGMNGSNQTKPTDLRDAIEAHRQILITLPRTYPDNSLPWVIADHLNSADIGGQCTIPIVIDGAKINPPNGSIESLSGKAFADSSCDGICRVFIIDNTPISSKPRARFIGQEVAAHPDARFIFITRGGSTIIKESEFTAHVGAEEFDICPVSFGEIAHFIERNFSLGGQESEVIALRLRDTFKQFQLAAHPSYFAGIPRETLSALLQANRRAELIELAVAGFLSHLVASDKGDIVVSRSTRARFLEDLAVEIKVNKRSFSHASLVDYTDAYSKKQDFEINPINFIADFTTRGILHFEDDRVRFSLPFIETYLLANALSRAPALADQYFQIGNSDFDFSAFDLYVEIGASTEQIERICTVIDRHMQGLAIPTDKPHILLTENVRPTILKSPQRLDRLKKRLQEAASDVRNGKGDIKGKQKVLDIADHVQESASRQSSEAKTAKAEQALADLDASIQIWMIATVLLGSGAEHLTASIKQKLASDLIALGSAVLHFWTETNNEFDPGPLKKDLLGQESISKLMELAEGKMTEAEMRGFIDNLVDAMEYAFLAMPTHRVIQQLCEGARHRVLAASVEKAQTADQMGALLHAAWLADIDAKRGIDQLNKAIKGLPNARFLRINLASHFLSRVYWSIWKQDDKLLLLDAAEEAIRPLEISFDKGAVKRIIENREADMGESSD